MAADLEKTVAILKKIYTEILLLSLFNSMVLLLEDRDTTFVISSSLVHG